MKMYQGADFQFTFTWKDESGALQNLTGYSARMQIREREESPNPLIELTNANSRILLGGVSGFITLKLSSTETNSFVASDWADPHVYDVEVMDGSGKVTRLLRGPLANFREVTR